MTYFLNEKIKPLDICLKKSYKPSEPTESMIKNSFIFLDGVNNKKERNIWAQNISSWDDFILSDNIIGISYFIKKHYDRLLFKAKEHLYIRDTTFFSSSLPSTETWRLYDDFKDECVFLDIEAGRGKHVDVIGLYDGENELVFHRNYNMNYEKIKRVLSEFKLIATFNGSSFDFPILKRKFKDVFPDVPHIDIRFLCSKIGLYGGLKNVEKQLGIPRTHNFNERNKSLKTLIEYNLEDVRNLKPILEHVIYHLKIDFIKHNPNSKDF